jgi:Plasmid pRiA4b ORF-3-like protein
MGMTSRRTRARKPARRQPEFVHQFLIVLSGTDPLVWRRIQVPLSYSFWDLHVAIQDAMGWLDYHLHEFRLLDGKGKVRAIGIPTGEEVERPPIPSWRVRISEYFNHRLYHALPALYVYDFGDDWEHALVYEDEQPIEDKATYPRCVGGARRCPPEDCGGVHGYTEFLAAISDRAHPERASLLAWAGGSYDLDAFDPTAVVFDDPIKRWKTAFERESS